MLVAGAANFEGRLTRWSTRASVVAPRYLVAPGENVVVDCNEKVCSLASGTSYAVSFVAGALSLLSAAHPELSAQDAAAILIASATDLGRRGIDPENGAGRLDVERALDVADRRARSQKKA